VNDWRLVSAQFAGSELEYITGTMTVLVARHPMILFGSNATNRPSSSRYRSTRSTVSI